jgi:hypothetical protein
VTATKGLTTVKNPYWDAVQKFPNDELRWNKSRFQPDSYPIVGDLMRSFRNGTPQPDLANFDESKALTRTSLVKQYAWAIPSNQTLVWIRKRFLGQEFVEIGAGRGYWAWMLEQVGIPTVAYDEKLVALGEENGYFKDGGDRTFHDVMRGGPEAAARHSDKVLFLCWPPYDNDLAVECLRAYQGDTLVYVGEGDGGCCANDDFFRELEEGWDEIDCHDDMIQWSGIHDYLWVYRRRVPALIKEEP